MHRLRVLVLTADYPPAQWSGIGTAVFHQVNALRERGVEVEVLTRERLSAERFPLEVQRDDIVHLHSLALAELALELTRRFQLPLVYTAHSLLARELRDAAVETRQWIELQRRVLDAATRLIFVSRHEHDAAIAAMPELAPRAHVLHNGVPSPPPLGAYDADGPIVFAGRFTRVKGFDLVLDLVRQSTWRFVLAGGHGDRDLHEAAQALRGGRCEVTGWLHGDALERLYASASLLLIPSRYEPFGMVAIEAMRLGAPVLASSALQELLPPQSGGRCVDEWSTAAWLAACETLLADPAERLAMHERGPLHVASHFDSRKLAPALQRLLHTGD